MACTADAQMYDSGTVADMVHQTSHLCLKQNTAYLMLCMLPRNGINFILVMGSMCMLRRNGINVAVAFSFAAFVDALRGL